MTVVCLLLPGVAWAQQGRPEARASAAALAPDLVVWRDTTDGLLRDGVNPAAAWRLGSVDPVVVVGLRRTQGGWRRPQEAERPLGAAAVADGGRPIGRWWLGGHFGYLRAEDRGVRWSSVADPYAGSPYVWADSIGGDWRRDHISTAATLSSPRWRAWRSGLSVRYAIGQGSRDNDPRPLYRIRRIGVTPGVTADLGKLRIGATATLAFEREEGEIGDYSQTDPFVFRLRGMTTFDRTGLRTADRTRAGRTVAAGVQLAGPGAGWSVALDHGADRDSTFDGVGSPADAGRFRRTWSRGAARARFGRIEGAVFGRTGRGRGTDPVFKAVNVVMQDDTVGLTLRTWRGAGPHVAPLTLAAAAEWSKSLRRDVAAGASWRASDLDMSLGAALRPGLARGRWLVVGRAGLLRSLDAEYVAGRASVMTSILGEADYRRAAADGFHWLVGTGFQIDTGRAGDLMLMVAYARREASGGAMMRRDDLTLTMVLQ